MPDAELSDTLIPNNGSSSDPVITDTDTTLPSNELSDTAITTDDVSSPLEIEPCDTVIPSTETTLIDTDSSLPKTEQSDVPSTADDVLPSSEGELSDAGAPSTDTTLINNDMSDSVTPNTDESLPNTDISDTVIPSTDSSLLKTDITDMVTPSIDSSDPAIINTDASVPSNELSDTAIDTMDDVSLPTESERSDTVSPSADTTPINNDMSNSVIPNTDQSLPDTELSDTAVPDTELSLSKTDISDVVAQNSDPSDADDTNTDTYLPDTDISTSIMPDDDSSLPTAIMSDVVAPNIDSSDPVITDTDLPLPSSDTSLPKSELPDPVTIYTDTSFPNTELSDAAIGMDDVSPPSKTVLSDPVSPSSDPINTDISDTVITTDNVSPSSNTDVIDDDAPNTDISNTEAHEALPEGDPKTGCSSPDISISDGYNLLHPTADELDGPDSIIPAVAVSGTMSQRQESLTEEEEADGEGMVTESDRQDAGGEEPQCDEEILQESPDEDEAASSPRGHDVMDDSPSLQQECENEEEIEEERGEELEQWKETNGREEEREAKWGEHQQREDEEEKLQLEEGQDGEKDMQEMQVEDLEVLRQKEEVEEEMEEGQDGGKDLQEMQVEDLEVLRQKEEMEEEMEEGQDGGKDLQEMQVEDLEVLRQKEEVEEEREEVQQRPQIPAAEPDSPVCQERGPQECEPAPPSPEPEGEGPQQTWSMATQTLHSVPPSGEETTQEVEHEADDTNNTAILTDRLTEEADAVTDSAERAEAHTDGSDSTDTLIDSTEKADTFIDTVTETADPTHAPTLSDVLTEVEESQSSPLPLTPADSLVYDLSVPSAAVEEPVPTGQLDLDTMNSGFGVLSTTLNVRPLLAQEVKEDGRPRFHKVSLVSTCDDSYKDCGPGPAEVQNDSKTHLDVKENQQSVQFQDGRSVPEEFVSWKSPWSNPEPSVSSYSHSSPLPLDTQHLSSLGTHQKASPSALSPEAPRSHGNAHWLSERSEVQLSWEREPGGRSWVEPAAPAGERESEQEINTGSEVQRLSDSRLSPTQTEVPFSGVFKATRVELLPSPTSPDPGSPYDMDSLVDTLKSMDRPQRQRGIRPAPLTAFNSLPPIVEDAPAPASKAEEKTVSSPQAVPNGKPTLPPDLGLTWSSQKDLRSPLEMMKRQQEQDGLGPRSISLPQRASADSSIVFRKASPEGSPSPHLNGGGHQSPSRLDNSLIFSSYRTPERPAENGKAPSHHPLLRATSLPETGPTHERISSAPQGGTDAQNKTPTRSERLSFLFSPTGSVTEGVESTRLSRPPSFTQNSLGEISFSSITTQPLDLHRSPPLDSPSRISLPPSTLGLQRSLSGDPPLGSPVLKDTQRGPHFTPNPEPERVQVTKYRAFPDAYLTKEKEHGKLNPRPGKMFIYDQPGMCGERIEVRSDVIDATAWQFPETISIRVVRGGWVLYEKPNYKGEKIALDEGDIELTYPFGPPEEGQQQEGGQEVKPCTERQFVIGSLRRAVRDYSVPEISLFPEENAEGKKVIFRDTSEDARIYGFPIKASSIIINAGLWLVYAHPFFEGIPRVLEVGGYPNPAAWGVTQPYVGSLHPLKIGEPRVEKPNEPRMVIYEKPYFTGKCREIYNHTRDFMTRVDRKQNAFMYNAGSIKVLGGCWVGYSKENFRGNQYLLEEGEYHDWRVWGGCDAELRSVRLIRADFTEPMMVMYAMPEEENEEAEEEQTFEVTEAIPDVEPYGFRTMTRSIHVLSGAWIAYSHVDFSGNQYILEKGFYNSYGDWGAEDNQICSVQPILLAVGEDPVVRNKILLYSEPDFQGNCQLCDQNQESLPEKFHIKSCRVLGGSWAVYEGEKFSGNPYILTEGDYPNFSSMGCRPDCSLRSLKIIPLMFAVPSISLFGLECFEGREITVDSEIPNLLNEGLNNHVLSVRVNSGCWVVCEHTNYRGRQVLLEPIEITNWVKFSELPTIGSMYPIRQKRLFFRIKNREQGHYLSIQGGVEEMKSGRVVVTEEVEGMSDVWFYQDGLIKNKLAPTMSLQVMGEVEPGAKVVLWAETRKPIQTWTAHMSGTIISLTFPGVVLDIKGGKTYDRNHVVIWGESEERPCQQWELELL
ncbi:beta/gamma crystallin domain-containing protein 2 [Megalops cyprinoides]|uniref:beta/gamma crystallin domain-containing protein 2 n=1 Tax=Megalops cyprinoides TaxID=118141 RepID=UPI00186503A9|nr:beta/gamma crystallin domain-containing protein 2 [Megalops cyprinoides]